MKQFSAFLLSLAFTLICNAQDEIIFNNQNIDKKEIKVSRTIHGIEFNTDFIRTLPGQYMGYIFGSVETQLNYFHENRIANTWTLFKSIGLGNAFYNKKIYNINGTNGYGSNIITERYDYELSINLKMEPRWYFDQWLRYKHNKSVENNTGWYISLPLTLTTNILTQALNGDNNQWITQKLIIGLIAPPTLGYRNAFAKKWFLEANVGYIPTRLWFQGGSFQMKSAAKIGLFSADSFNSELKIAYTF